DRIQNGMAGVHFAASDEALLFKFSVQQNPYLGIWLCYGGWPVNGNEKHLTVGIEPASGRPDSLAKAIENGDCTSLAPGDTAEWHLILTVLENFSKNNSTAFANLKPRE
ncbi:MAG: hypothetical protein WAN36_15085, partial [Calditrichia bacterium]